MFGKIDIFGKKADPLYKWLRLHTRADDSKFWNFEKFLINKHGQIIKHFDHQTEPNQIRPAVVDLINRG